MAKAKRVHSTPRRIASKVQHPPAKKPAKVTEAERAVLYGALENPVCECAHMAEMTLDAHSAGDAYAEFAVGKLCEMVLALREIYYGRDAGPIMERS
jgi:hypothetical protein